MNQRQGVKRFETAVRGMTAKFVRILKNENGFLSVVADLIVSARIQKKEGKECYAEEPR